MHPNQEFCDNRERFFNQVAGELFSVLGGQTLVNKEAPFYIGILEWAKKSEEVTQYLVCGSADPLQMYYGIMKGHRGDDHIMDAIQNSEGKYKLMITEASSFQEVADKIISIGKEKAEEEKCQTPA